MGIGVELYVATCEIDSLLSVGRLSEAEEVAVNALDRARHHGVERGVVRANLLSHAAEASVELGLIDRAAELTDGLRDHAPESDNWAAHLMRARVEVCQGAIERAVARVEAIRQLGVGGSIAAAYMSQRTFAWVALWAGDPRGALEWVETGPTGTPSSDEVSAGAIRTPGR